MPSTLNNNRISRHDAFHPVSVLFSRQRRNKRIVCPSTKTHTQLTWLTMAFACCSFLMFLCTASGTAYPKKSFSLNMLGVIENGKHPTSWHRAIMTASKGNDPLVDDIIGHGHDSEDDGYDSPAPHDNTQLATNMYRLAFRRSSRLIIKHLKTKMPRSTTIWSMIVVLSMRREIYSVLSTLSMYVWTHKENILQWTNSMKKLVQSSWENRPDISFGNMFKIAIFLNILNEQRTHRKSSVYIPSTEQHYTFEALHNQHQHDSMAFRKAAGISTSSRTKKKTNKKHTHSQIAKKDTVIVLESQPHQSPSRFASLSNEISFLLHLHRSLQLQSRSDPKSQLSNHHTEIVLQLESLGGAVGEYGLASSQLARLRNEPNMTLTVLVDKVAASGGYMMACQASPGQLYAAPFATLGSIGVVFAVNNVHKILTKFGIKPYVFTGGKDKILVNPVEEVTQEQQNKQQNEIDLAHQEFQNLVIQNRPEVLPSALQGAAYLGSKAIEAGLIDGVLTGEEYVTEKLREGFQVWKLVTCDARRGFLGSMRKHMNMRSDEVMNVVSNQLVETVSLCMQAVGNRVVLASSNLR